MRNIFYLLSLIYIEPTYGVCWSYCKSEKNDILKNYIKNALAILIEMAYVALDISKGISKFYLIFNLNDYFFLCTVYVEIYSL